MKTAVVALHGFLGKGNDWDAVRAASKADMTWICPDFFAPGADSFAPPDVEGPCWLAGYSFGARLALRWMNKDPERWLGALLLSVNPGNFQSDEDRGARRAADNAWAARFREESWEALVRSWNSQKIFGARTGPDRTEADYDRRKLSAALVDLSVGAQFTDPMRLPVRMVWLAGLRDAKFRDLLGNMRDAGFPGSFMTVPDAGHRLLHEAPRAVAAALDHLVA